jgi:NADH dehydrogenase FAD-containing subunit
MEGQELEAPKKKLVVIGGGIAGSLLAKSLQFLADVILIDP